MRFLLASNLENYILVLCSDVLQAEYDSLLAQHRVSPLWAFHDRHSRRYGVIFAFHLESGSFTKPFYMVAPQVSFYLCRSSFLFWGYLRSQPWNTSLLWSYAIFCDVHCAENSFLPSVYQNKSGLCESASVAYRLHALQLYVPVRPHALPLQLSWEQLYPSYVFRGWLLNRYVWRMTRLMRWHAARWAGRE